MLHFNAKFTVLLVAGLACSSVAMAGDSRNCHYAFGHGVTEQIVGSPPTIPNPNPNIGPIHLRIGPVRVEGIVDVLVTEGFNVFGFNAATGEGRITGVAKGTFDFGPELGMFHTWEVDTVTFIGPPPWETSFLQGNIRTGPARDAIPDPFGPPMPWGTGFFANTDATLTGMGWNRFNVVNQQGTVVNEFTYLLWGKICDVDLRSIRGAQRN